jgi:hypothetical protein
VDKLLVVDSLKDFSLGVPGLRVLTAREYLGEGVGGTNRMVFNLCKQYRYQSRGYYVSLLAEARGIGWFPTWPPSWILVPAR